MSSANRSLVLRRARSAQLLAVIWACALLVVCAPAGARTQELPHSGELSLALDKLEVLASVLYVAAHPDDENTALLSYLSRGTLARTAYLSLTRGDGGQNLIGTERGELLGVVRTQELLEARRLDGAEQYFTRAIDFGYTKSVDEALEKWGREEVLGDVVRVMRSFRPDVVVMRFPGDGRGGHGQHTASAVLAKEAFDAAGDPERFPEQLTGEHALTTWQPVRLLWDAARFFGPGAMEHEGSAIEVDVGGYSPRLGASFTEIAAQSRSMHKSQGFGAAASRGSRTNRLEHRLGTAARTDLFDDIDTRWSRVGGEEVGELLSRAARDFDPLHPHRSTPLLLQALARLDRLEQATSPWARYQRQELTAVITATAGLRIDLLAQSATAAPGEEVELRLEAINRSPIAAVLRSVRLPGARSEHELARPLADNELLAETLRLAIPAEQQLTQPYWLELPPSGELFTVTDPHLIGQPDSRPLVARVALQLSDSLLELDIPVRYRWTDRVEGERFRNFAVVPEVAVELGSSVLVFAEDRPQEVTVTVRGGAAGSAARLELEVPRGWSVRPAVAEVELPATGRAVQQAFLVTPPSAPSSGALRAVLTSASGATFERSSRTIDYRHIPVQTLWEEAAGRVVRLDLQRRGDRIGYVVGAGDEIPEALRQIGYEVVLLGDEDLAAGDLSAYDAIVLGVRAYNARPAVLEQRSRLLRYVADGGTLVSQYNTISRRSGGENSYGPYPFSLSRDRVSVEEAPVTLLQPDHPVLREPNQITSADFEGWVQERGLYFPNQWDERYTALLASNDPGEPPREGGLLVAEYGSGIYIYTGYSFFRELPAGVPGAYRLFANLLSARQ